MLAINQFEWILAVRFSAFEKLQTLGRNGSYSGERAIDLDNVR